MFTKLHKVRHYAAEELKYKNIRQYRVVETIVYAVESDGPRYKFTVCH